MTKYLNSEQAKADETAIQSKSIEQLEKENAQLLKKVDAAHKLIAQYAIQIAQLQLQISEFQQQSSEQA